MREPHHQVIACSLKQTLGNQFASSFLEGSQQNPVDQPFPGYRVPHDAAMLIFRSIPTESLGRAAQVCWLWRKLA